jgi:hypothetical protein
MSGSLSATASNASLLDGTGSVGFTTTASFTAVSSSQQQISASLLTISRSYATTGSNTFTGVQNFSNTCNPIGFNSVASLYTAGGLQVSYDSYFSSSVFVNGNLTVFGTQSVVHVSSSQFNVGTNIITVNTATPSIRYGGLSVYDSGSTGLSGSILWDSELNRWIYANASGSGGGATYGGGMFISGPRNTQGLGCEQGTTSCMLLVGQGGDHLTSSLIYHSSTVTCVPNTLKVGADITVDTRNISLAGYPTSICFGNGQSIYDNGGGGLNINGQNSIQFITCTTASLNITSNSFVGVGTTTPCREFHVKGEILFQARSPFSANNSMYRFIPRSADCAFQFQLANDVMTCETTVWSVCRNAQTVTSFNIENGNVGIGTCAPSTKLHMYNGTNPLSLKIQRTTVPVYLSDVQLAGTTAGAVWSHNLENTSNGSVSWGGFSNTSYAGSAIILQSDTGNSFITLHTAPSNNTVPTERLRIGGAGTFGINCSGVAARTMVVKGVTGCYIVAEFIESAGVHSIEVYPNKSGYNLISSDYMSGGTFLPLSLSGRENASDLVLSPTGRVGVGNDPGCLQFYVYTTGCTITSGNVTFRCQAKGIEVYNACSGNTNNVIGYWISTGPHKVGIASGRTNAESTWEVDLRFYTHPTTIDNLDSTYENMRLYGGGNLTINGTLTQNGGLSDCRQKENLIRISNPLDIISCIGGYNFEWKEGSPSRRDFMCIVEDAGLIAQEVETVMPNIVRETKWDCLKTLNYNGITALLVEGMKAQQCTINALKSCLGIA